MSSDSENNNPEKYLECGDSKKRTPNKRLENQKIRINGTIYEYEGMSVGNVPCDRIPSQMREPCSSKFCLKCSVRH